MKLLNPQRSYLFQSKFMKNKLINNHEHQSPHTRRNLVISLVLSIFALMYIPFLFILGEKLWKIFGMKYIQILSLFFGFVSLMGLILAILSLKFPYKKLAIFEIFVCVITLLVIIGFNVLVYILLPMTL